MVQSQAYVASPQLEGNMLQNPFKGVQLLNRPTRVPTLSIVCFIRVRQLACLLANSFKKELCGLLWFGAFKSLSQLVYDIKVGTVQVTHIAVRVKILMFLQSNIHWEIRIFYKNRWLWALEWDWDPTSNPIIRSPSQKENSGFCWRKVWKFGLKSVKTAMK